MRVRVVALWLAAGIALAGCSSSEELWPGFFWYVDFPPEAENLSDQVGGADAVLVGTVSGVDVVALYPDDVPKGVYNSFTVTLTVDTGDDDATVRYVVDFGGRVDETHLHFAGPLHWDRRQEYVFMVDEDPRGDADYVCATAYYICPLFVEDGQWHSPVQGPSLDSWLADADVQPSTTGSPYDSLRALAR